RHPRPLLLRMEPAHRTTVEDHVNRTPGLGASMIPFAGWYKLAAEIVATATENGPRQEQDATRPGKKSSKRKKKPSPKS
ncbi:MAG: hypothetical protein V1244_03675, partial [Nitrospinaceae bacterium]|nr:hypothetical protein [Nitrospinaceae bacterium]